MLNKHMCTYIYIYIDIYICYTHIHLGGRGLRWGRPPSGLLFEIIAGKI